MISADPREAGQSVQTLPLAPPTGNKEKYGWLARLGRSVPHRAWVGFSFPVKLIKYDAQ